MALNVAPAMTQAPTQGQGQGNTAVSGGSLRPGQASARYGSLVFVVAELFDRGSSWVLGSVVGFSDRIVSHRLGCTPAGFFGLSSLVCVSRLPACCLLRASARKGAWSSFRSPHFSSYFSAAVVGEAKG